MNEQETSPADIASRFYALAKAGNWDEASRLVATDFAVVEAPNLPFGGRLQGKKAVQHIFELVGQSLRISGADVLQVTTGGEYVVSLLELIAHDEDGSTHRLAVAESLRIVNGLIVELKPYYFDHDLVRKVATQLRHGSTA